MLTSRLVIAATTEQRIPSLPEVPTIAELGYPSYEISSWQGIFAPANTPKEIVAKINGETTKLLAESAVRERISKEGADPVGSSPEQFDKRFRNEVEKWAKVAKAAGLMPK